jgi:hypothetical protein
VVKEKGGRTAHAGVPLILISHLLGGVESGGFELLSALMLGRDLEAGG